MKQIWTQFKNWLIIKLGGHTYSKQMVKVQVQYEEYNTVPVVVHTELPVIVIDKDRLTEKEVNEIVEDRLINELIPIIRDRLTIRSVYNPQYDTYQFEGKLLFSEKK